MSGECSTASMPMNHIPSARVRGLSLNLIIGFSMSWKSSILRHGQLRGGICGGRSAEFGMGLLVIDHGMLCGSASRPRIATLLLMSRLLVPARTQVSMLRELPSRSPVALQREATW
jgi:hypothetical protein